MKFIDELQRRLADEEELERLHTGVTIDYQATRAEHRAECLREIIKLYRLTHGEPENALQP